MTMIIPLPICPTCDNKIQADGYCCTCEAFIVIRNVSDSVDSIVAGLKALTDEQRMEIFGNFCTSCGCDDPHCQCWNDK